MIYDASIITIEETHTSVLFSCAVTDYEEPYYQRAVIFDKVDQVLGTTGWEYGTEEGLEEMETDPPEWVQRLFITVFPRLEDIARTGNPCEIARFV